MANVDDDAIPTDYCKNCKRDIPSVNYIIHQTHCSRNIVLCNQCEEPVPRSEMDEHNEEYHAKVTCKCGEAVEKCKQEEHDAEHCPQRQVQCEYCEMGMNFKDLDEHRDFCGSRTDSCPLCNRYIFFRDKAMHDESNCQYPEVKPNPAATSSLSSLSTHQRQRNQFMFGSLDSAEALRQQQELFDQSSVAPLVRNVGPLAVGRDGIARDMRRMLSEEMVDDRKHRKNLDRVQNMMAKSGTRSREKNEERALLQSMVNQEESDERLARHLSHDLSYDASDAVPFPSDKFQSASRDFEDNIDIHGIMKENYGISAINTFNQPSDNLTLPCEFCQQQIPAENLIEHQTGCRPDISCHPVPDSSLANNSRQRSHQQSHQPQPPSDVVNNLGYGALPSGYSGSSFGQPDNSQGYDDDNLTMIPCEFCEELLPADAIPMHQVNCNENRIETPLPTTFETAPGSYPTRRGGAVESLIKPNPQKVQRPQDFVVPNRPKKYAEQQPVIDPSVDDDEDEDVDVIPVKMDKSRHPHQSHSQYPRKTCPMTFQQRTSSSHLLGQSASDKYPHRSNRGGHARSTAAATGLPSGGAIPKPKAKNTVGQSRYFEERPQSKSSARVQETLQGLCDTPVLPDEEEELNNVVGSRLNSRLGEQDSYPPGSYRSKSTKAIPSSYGPSSVETDGQPAAPFQTRPSLGYNNLPRQPFPGARQKMPRKPHVNNSRSSGHGDGYSPSFARGENQHKGRERMGTSGASRRAKQQSASTTMTFDPNGLNQSTTLQVKGEAPVSRTSNQKSSQKRRPTPPRQNARKRDDAIP